MSQLRAPRIIHDDHESIEGHVVAAFARYERVLVALVPALEELRVVDPDDTIKRLRFRVETLAGFVVGAAQGAKARAARRGPGADARDLAGILIGRIVRYTPPVMTTSEIALHAPHTHGPGRGEIAPALHAQLPGLAGAVEQLAAAAAPALAFFDQQASSWRHYTAVMRENERTRRLRLVRPSVR